MYYIETMEYYSAIENEILPFATTQMNLEGFMLSEISQRRTNIIWYSLYVKSKKYNKLVNITKQEQTHRTKLAVTSGGGRSTEVREEEVQTVEGRTGSGMHWTTWGILPILCSNLDAVPFKNCVQKFLKKRHINLGLARARHKSFHLFLYIYWVLTLLV